MIQKNNNRKKTIEIFIISIGLITFFTIGGSLIIPVILDFSSSPIDKYTEYMNYYVCFTALGHVLAVIFKFDLLRLKYIFKYGLVPSFALSISVYIGLFAVYVYNPMIYLKDTSLENGDIALGLVLAVDSIIHHLTHLSIMLLIFLDEKNISKSINKYKKDTRYEILYSSLPPITITGLYLSIYSVRDSYGVDIDNSLAFIILTLFILFFSSLPWIIFKEENKKKKLKHVI